jgi:O-antigen ligase
MLIIVLLVILLLFGLPQWGYWGDNRNYGYWPSGLILLILLVVLLAGRF